jgi:hypothetical protein
MLSMAQLKRDAKTGMLQGEMILFHGKTDIPERLQGTRQIIDAYSSGIKFLDKDGKKSDLRIESANLIEYDGETLTVYAPGLRDLDANEKAVFDKWEQLKRQLREDHSYNLAMYDTSNIEYYRRKDYFCKSGYEYLLGNDTKQGKRYMHHEEKVRDNQIKGNVQLKYRIYRDMKAIA